MAKAGGKKGRAPAPGFGEYESALHEAATSLPPVLLFLGEDAFLRRAAIETIHAALHKKHPDIEDAPLRGSSTQGDKGASIGDLLRELSGGSLFATRKCVLFRDANEALFPRQGSGESASASSKKETPADQLLHALAAPDADTWILLDCKNIDKRRALGKKLESLAHVIPCPALKQARDAEAFLRHVAHQQKKTLATGVADILLQAYGHDCGTLSGEIEKLSLYVGDTSTITEEDASTFLTGSMEFDIFGLTNAIQSRDLPEALGYVRKILVQGTKDKSGRKSSGESSAHAAMFSVSKMLQHILAARALQAERGTKEDLGALLGISPWRAGHLQDAARLYTIADLRRAVNVAADQMRASHDTGGDPALALERIVIAACKKPLARQR